MEARLICNHNYNHNLIIIELKGTVCTLGCLIKVHSLITARERHQVKINKSPVLNKDIQEGQISKNKRPGAL